MPAIRKATAAPTILSPEPMCGECTRLAGTTQKYDGELMAVGGARIVYVGHATVLVEMDGVRLVTDPVLRPRLLH